MHITEGYGTPLAPMHNTLTADSDRLVVILTHQWPRQIMAPEP